MSRRTTVAAPVVAAVAGLMLFAAAAVRPAAATLIVVPNASFQNPDMADGAFTNNFDDADPVPDWTFTPTLEVGGIVSSGVWDPAAVNYTFAGGDNVDSDGPGPSIGGQNAYIYLEQENDLDPQDLQGDLTTDLPVAQLESDTSYTLTVAVGREPTVQTGDVTLQLVMTGDFKFSLASLRIPAGTIAPNTFTDYTVNLTTFEDYPFAGQELRARITHAWSGTGAVSVDFDNVRFEVAPIPEPASAGVLAIMAPGAMAAFRRRRCGRC